MSLYDVAAHAIEGAFKQTPETDHCDLTWFLFKAVRIQAAQMFGHFAAEKMLAAHLRKASEEATRCGAGDRRRRA